MGASVTLRLSALRHSAFYTPYLLTFSRDYLARQGLSAHYQPAKSFDQLTHDLQYRRVDISQSAVGASLVSDDGTEHIKNRVVHFAQINSRDGFFILARHQPAATDNNKNFNWQVLGGKTVLVDHLFQPLAMFMFILAEKNIAAETLNIIDAGDVDAMLQAWLAGEGDYIHLQGPYAQQLEKSGQGKIVAAVGDVIGPIAFSSLCCHEDFAGSKQCAAFYAAFGQAMQDCQSDAADKLANDIQYLFDDIEPAVLRETIADYQQLGCWGNRQDGNNTLISESEYERVMTIFLSRGVIKNPIPYARYIRQL